MSESNCTRGGVDGCIRSNPQDGILGLKENWKRDLVSGLLVSLIGLPLSIAIAMASGFPAFGGLITAIIGGIIVAPFCGSRLTIKGPAAGLIAISVAAVETLGNGNLAIGYRYTLAVVVVAGLIQVVFALFKFGKYSDFFPSAAVHGMLSAIGLIIISKQIHPLFGVKPVSKEPISLILEIPDTLIRANPEVALIGLVSFIICFVLPRTLKQISKYIPAPLIAVMFGVTMSFIFDIEHEHSYHLFNHNYLLNDQLLIDVPKNFISGSTFPDFSLIYTLDSFKFILMFALVGSLESLLTVKAVDMLDPYQRKSDVNKDLFVIGIANSICGFVGGLPMIAEVVRSYSNVANGAKTRWANFFHGIALLAFLVLIPNLLHKIPVASLAGILCYVGCKLASPSQFKHSRLIGVEQLVVFCITIIGTLATDLLVGVALGVFTEYAFCLYFGAKIKDIIKGEIVVIQIAEDKATIVLPRVCYIGKIMNFMQVIDRNSNKSLELDFSSSRLVDHSFMKVIDKIKKDSASSFYPISVKGLDRLKPIGSSETSLRRIN